MRKTIRSQEPQDALRFDAWLNQAVDRGWDGGFFAGQPNADNENLLCWVIRYAPDLAEVALGNGWLQNEKEKKPDPFHYAAQFNDHLLPVLFKSGDFSLPKYSLVNLLRTIDFTKSHTKANLAKISKVQKFLTHGFDLNYSSPRENAILSELLIAEKWVCPVATLKWLVEHGSDPNHKSYRNFTPLMNAQTVPQMEYLMSVGADPLQVSVVGHTALMCAAQKGLVDCLIFLYPISDPNAVYVDSQQTAFEILHEKFPDAYQECMARLSCEDLAKNMQANLAQVPAPAKKF